MARSSPGAMASACASMPMRLVTMPWSLRSPKVHSATSERVWRSCQHNCRARVDLPAAIVPYVKVNSPISSPLLMREPPYLVPSGASGAFTTMVP